MTKKRDPLVDKILNQLAETKRGSAEATVDWRIGEAVIALLKDRDALSLNDLLGHFERQVAESPSAKGSVDPTQDMARISAEAVIRRLRGLRADS